MDMLFIVLHVLFGLGSFAGSLMLAVGFKDKFNELNTLQKSGILLTIISLFATIAVTMVSKGNMIAAIIFIALGVVACCYLAFAKTKVA